MQARMLDKCGSRDEVAFYGIVSTRVTLELPCNQCCLSRKHLEVSIISTLSSVGCRRGGGCSSRYESGTRICLPLSSVVGVCDEAGLNERGVEECRSSFGDQGILR